MLLTDSQAPLAPSRPRSQRFSSTGATPTVSGCYPVCPDSARPCCSARRAAKHVGDREVSRQNGALIFWSCCSRQCLWTTGSPAPALGAGLQLPVTLSSGSAFRGTRDSLPIPGCRLSRDSAAESLSVSAAPAFSCPLGGCSVAVQWSPAARAAPLPWAGACPAGAQSLSCQRRLLPACAACSPGTSQLPAQVPCVAHLDQSCLA